MPSRPADLVVATAASTVVVLGAVDARRGTVRPAEVRCFTRLNARHDGLHGLVWPLMQAGSLGGTLAVGAALGALGHPHLGRRTATVGALAWVASKAIKPFARRGRPAVLVDARVLGRPQAGLGYPSGHAAVASAMAAAVTAHLPAGWRLPTWAAAVGIGATRVYVGAHLPLDVLGGCALGVATERAARTVTGRA